MLPLLNIIFFVLHTAFTLFNLFGWLWPGTRKWHLLTLGITYASWFGLGIWYGWGYCPCTDWHWAVRAKLGYHDSANNYIEFLLETLTGLSIATHHMETWLVAAMVILTLLSVVFNIRDVRKRSRSRA